MYKTLIHVEQVCNSSFWPNGVIEIPACSTSLILKDTLFLSSLNSRLHETGTHIDAFAVPNKLESWSGISYLTLQ